MPFENLTVEIEDRIATVTINRPDKLNALNRATLDDLGAAFAELKDTAEVGVVILTGAGDKAFVAGADIQEMAEMSPAEAQAYSLRGQAVFSSLEQLGKPVIAAINGFALGGGMELAMACSLRVASDAAQLGQPEVTLGLIPGFAGTQRLPRLVGKGRALELLLTGDRIPASAAHDMGLVNRVVAGDQLMAEARKLAGRILARGPLAVGYCLEAVQRGLDGPYHEGERYEAALFGLIFSSQDMREGTAAFLEKRKPQFKGC
jgi:enoyl-CoA hydratase